MVMLSTLPKLKERMHTNLNITFILIKVFSKVDLSLIIYKNIKGSIIYHITLIAINLHVSNDVFYILQMNRMQ